MQKLLYTLSILMLTLIFSYAGNKEGTPIKRNCGTEMPTIQWQQNFQQQVQQYRAQNNSQNRINATYVLPVIVHVVYYNAAENISAAQINSQIDVLNADFAGTGLNVNTCPSAFQSLISNTNISFCKATKDPNGNTLTEPGIDRVNAQTEGFTDPGSGWAKSYVTNTIKPATFWDPTKYLNIWVLPLGGGLLGYATFPGGASNIDGVVIGHTYYGNTGLVSAPYDKGRTTTHEVGHWLGLYHISGDSECGDDECNDTPPQRGNEGDGQGLNYGCPTFPHQPNSCTGTGANGELFMNFMDYTNDVCMYLFTPDQRERMQTVMSGISMRSQLATSTVCNTTPQAPVANFSANRTSVCPGNTVSFTDLSTNIPTSWSWSFPGGTPATVTGTNAASQNPTITYNTAGTYSVTLTATNGLGSDGETKTGYITVGNPTGSSLPFAEGFQTATFPPTGWSLSSASSFNWERTTAAGGFGTSNASMYFNNYDDDPAGQKSDILSPIINLNGATTPRLRFEVAYAPYLRNNGTSKYDTLEVLITDFCANTTTSIYKKGGTQLATASTTASAFIPTAAQWRRDSVSIPGAYLNKNVKITFRNYGLFANNIYVDNINLYSVGATTPTPTASFTASDTTVCASSNLTFTSTSTASSGSLDSIRWTIPGGIPSTSTASSVTSTFNTAGTYIITLKAYKSGNVSTATKSIRVKALPVVAAITGAATVCVGATTNYATTTTGGTWSSSATGTATVNASGVVTGVSAGACEIRYMVVSSGCTTMVTKVITVNALPTVSAITGTTTICTGSTSTLSSTPSGGAWLSSNTTVATVNSSGVVTGVSAGTANIYYTVTGANTCQKSVAATVTINTTPNVTVTSPTICAGSTATIQASGATTYSWSGGLGTGNPKTTLALTTTTTYIVTGTTGSCSKTAISTVTVNATAPTVTITPTPSASVCFGTSVTLQAGGANNYTWNSTQTGTTSGATLTFTPNGNITVNLSGTLTGCTTAGTTSINLTVKPKPSVGVTSLSICNGQTATMQANGASTYSWSAGLGSGNPKTTPALTTTTTYTVTGTDANNCTNTAVSTVTVKLLPPTPTITQRNDSLFCSTIGGASYNWYRNNVFLVTTNVPNLKITQSGTYSVEVVGTNSCTSVRSANFNGTYTAIKNNKLDIQYAIVPNPNNGLFELNITSNTNKTYQLRLFSVSGQIIMEDQINLRIGQNNKRINVFGIEKGVYFLSVIGDEGISTQSVLIQ